VNLDNTSGMRTGDFNRGFVGFQFDNSLFFFDGVTLLDEHF